MSRLIKAIHTSKVNRAGKPLEKWFSPEKWARYSGKDWKQAKEKAPEPAPPPLKKKSEAVEAASETPEPAAEAPKKKAPAKTKKTKTST